MSEWRFERAAALRRLANEDFDVLVIGGGVTGVGVVLDAASRGLRAALVERGDFAAGTSSMSSKMIHGGIRYLQQREFRLVYQSLSERQRLLRNAPHLVRTMPFLIPIYTKGGLIPRFLCRLFGLVLWFYDVTGGARIGHRHRRLDAAETVARMPTLVPERIHCGYLYYDAQVDDARLTLAIARTAALDHGAVVVNHAAVVGFSKDERGKAVGVTVDAGDEQIDVRARVIVNAAGVWIDSVDLLAGDRMPSTRPARGVHVVVPHELVRNDAAMILAVPGTRSTVFAVPWGPVTYVGTTDTDYRGELDHPYCTSEDVEYLLGSLNAWTTEPVQRSDVVGTWAGLRPLLHSAENAKTADLSRRHRVTRAANGVITVAGGKLTTWRRMAEDTVDEVLATLGRTAACGTASLPLRGAVDWDQFDAAGVDATTRNHLAGRFGSEAPAVIGLLAADPSLAEPLVPGLPYLRAEARYAVEHEMAMTVDDVLARRTRARLLARDASAAAAASVAAVMAGPLGWSDEEQARHAADYRSLIERERQACEGPSSEPTAGADRQPGWVPGARMSRRLAHPSG